MRVEILVLNVDAELVKALGSLMDLETLESDISVLIKRYKIIFLNMFKFLMQLL
jgi:hypothetical protein